MKDFLDQELTVGDRVVYGGNLGRCAAVGVGIIVELNNEPPKDEWHEPMMVKVLPERTQQEYTGCNIRIPLEVHKPRWFKFANRMVKIV